MFPLCASGFPNVYPCNVKCYCLYTDQIGLVYNIAPQFITDTKGSSQYTFLRRFCQAYSSPLHIVLFCHSSDDTTISPNTSDCSCFVFMLGALISCHHYHAPIRQESVPNVPTPFGHTPCHFFDWLHGGRFVFDRVNRTRTDISVVGRCQEKRIGVLSQSWGSLETCVGRQLYYLTCQRENVSYSWRHCRQTHVQG